MRKLLIALWVLLGALPLGVASAAAPPAGFYGLLPTAESASSSHQVFEAVFVAADGSRFTRLGTSFPWPPVFSPDGAHLATTNADENLVVENADGSQPRVLTTDGKRPTKYSDSGEPDTVVNVQPTWSPDGSRLAWQKHLVTGGWEIWTSRVDGTGSARIAAGTSPAWSPTESLVLSVRRPSAGDVLDVTDADNGPLRSIPLHANGTAALWSPDGARVAVVSPRRIRVVDVTTGALSVVWDAAAASTKIHYLTIGGSSWSADGRRILFELTDFISVPQGGGATLGWSTDEVYSVAAAGGRPVRLTGPPSTAIQSGGDLASQLIGPWPDGSRIFIERGGYDLFEMNADGSCERPFPVNSRGVLWPPGARPGLGRLVCADLGVRIEPPPRRLLRHPARLRLTVWNDGNVAAAPNVVVSLAGGLTVRSPSARCKRGKGNIVDCNLATLAPQAVTHLDLSVEGRKAGTLHVNARVIGSGRADPLGNDSARELVTVLPCTLAGTAKADVLKAHYRYEKICGFGGDDRINSANGHANTIDCGAGNDTAIVDRRDTVKNCEHVIRR
jgi:Tol biopolymer transport system component